jgi:hypothetical protein
VSFKNPWDFVLDKKEKEEGFFLMGFDFVISKEPFNGFL